MRLVVVGSRETYDRWAASLSPESRRVIRPVYRWSDMLTFQRATVEFMRDWRTGSDRTDEENDRIYEEAVRMDQYRKQMMNPFSGSQKGGKQ